MIRAEASQDGARGYFVLALLAFVLLATFAPWAALLVCGYAYATPIRRHPRLLPATWIIGGLLTSYFLVIVAGVLFPTTYIQVGPVHRIP